MDKCSCVVVLFVALSCSKAVLGLKPCRGVFDLIFVLDKSGSISGSLFATSTVEFVREVSSHFISPLLAMSFITFSNEAQVHLSLTTDRNKVDEALTELSTLQGSGGTHMSEGLSKAIEQIEEKRSQSSVALDNSIVTVIVVLTDGKVRSLQETLIKAGRARELGAVLYAVGVANYDLDQLNQVADNPPEDHVFQAEKFDDLPRLVHTIINRTCIEILAAYPTTFCSEGNHLVLVNGNGFTRGRTANAIVCNFLVNGTISHKTRPLMPVQDDRLSCESPRLSKAESNVILQISVNNGTSYVSSNISLTIKSCEDGSTAMGAVIGALVIIFGLLFLLLLWWFWPLCVGGVAAAKTEDDPDNPRPPRNVSASYYGGRGPGGMREMRVDWGNRGSTSEGSKLTPAKDATVTEPPVPPCGYGKEPGCWDRMKGAFSGCWAVVVAKYAYVASFRPVKGQSGCYSKGKRSSSYVKGRTSSTSSNVNLVSKTRHGSTSNNSNTSPSSLTSKPVQKPVRPPSGSIKSPPPSQPNPPAGNASTMTQTPPPQANSTKTPPSRPNPPAQSAKPLPPTSRTRTAPPLPKQLPNSASTHSPPGDLKRLTVPSRPVK